MKKDSSNEFAMAFAVGALLGVGAALLLAPDPPTRREKLMKELKPYRKKLRKKVAAARSRKPVSAAAEMGDELMEAGRTVARDLRDEVTELVADARAEIAATVEEQLEAAQHALRKGAKRMRN